MAMVSQNLLQGGRKLLVMSPLALGDFLYLNTFLGALKQQHPDLEIDLWFDDNRNNDAAWRLSRSRLLQQWMAEEATYTRLYGCVRSRAEQDQAIGEASRQAYDVILVINQSKARRYVQVARRIAPGAVLVLALSRYPLSMRLMPWFCRRPDHLYVSKAHPLPPGHHITDRYHALVREVFGVEWARDRFMPRMGVPEAHLRAAEARLAARFPAGGGRLIFLNHRSTSRRRDWRPDQLSGLISRIAAQEPARFIINVAPEHLEGIEAWLKAWDPALAGRVLLSTAREHFFELPALIALSDLVVSVETATMHFALALGKPLIALMRGKKPYWAPPRNPKVWVLYAPGSNGSVGDITVEEAFQAYLEQRAGEA